MIRAKLGEGTRESPAGAQLGPVLQHHQDGPGPVLSEHRGYRLRGRSGIAHHRLGVGEEAVQLLDALP